MKFILDGQIIRGAIDGAEGSQFTEQAKNENGRLSKSYSADLTFYEDGYTIIRDALIIPLDGKTQKINVKVYDDCCKDENGNDQLFFEGIIRGDSIDWCEGDCFVKATLIEETEETQQMDCLKSTFVFDDTNGFQSKDHPRMHYCIELRPSFYQELIISLGVILNLILIILTPIVAIIGFIVRVVSKIPGVNLNEELEDGLLDDYFEWIRKINDSLIGCGREHPSPLVRDYIKNVCEICGVGFESSIFTDPTSDYYNTVYYNNPIEKGTKDRNTKYIEQNKPIKTLEGFLEDLKIPFNADYKIIDGVLRFERYDYFHDGQEWINYAQLKAAGRIISEPCYEWRAEEKQAATNFQWSSDPVDWVGNEALPYYNEIVGQNEPYSTLQRGVKDVIMPFGVPRFRDDLIDRDVVGQYAAIPILSQAVQGSDGAIVQNNGTNFQPKLIIWDGKSIERAKVKKWNKSSRVNIFDIGALSRFRSYPIDEVGHNWAMQFNEDGVLKNTAYPSDQDNMAMYGRFHSIDTPQAITDRGWSFTMTIKYTCDTLRSRSIYKLVTLPEGAGRITKLEIDPEKQHITIQGEL